MVKLLLVAVIVGVSWGYPLASPDEPPVYIPVEYAHPPPAEYPPPPAEYPPPPAEYPPPPAYPPPQHKPVHKEEPKKPYAFDYGVKDDYSGNNFNHVENSDGNSVKGSYKVVLPDGRIQTVNYIADHYNGFQAQVAYEGEAQYPETKPYKPQPSYHPAPAPSYPAPAPPHPPYPVEPAPSYPMEPVPAYSADPPPSYPAELPPPPSYPIVEPPPPEPQVYPEEPPIYLN